MADQNLRTTRKVKQGLIELDYAEAALIVNFELEVVIKQKK